jgi:hypothetical protein
MPRPLLPLVIVPPRGRPKKGEGSAEPVSPASRNKRKKRWYRACKNSELPSRQYNFTDPDSRVMYDNRRKYFGQGYNAQLAVDGTAQVIVAADITQQAIDREQLLPMVARTKDMIERLPDAITADAGYWDGESLQHESVATVTLLVSPDSKPITPASSQAKYRKIGWPGRCVNGWPVKPAMSFIGYGRPLLSRSLPKSKSVDRFGASRFGVLLKFVQSGALSV